MVRTCLKPSRLLAAAFAATHVLAAATLLPLDLPVAVKVAGAGVIAGSLWRSLRLYAMLRAPQSIVALEIHDQQTAAACCADGIWHDAKILGTTYVTPGLTVINLRRTGARLVSHVLLTADNIDQEDFRSIRVLLRWARPKPSAAASAIEARSAS